ncbi:MAG: alpha/beta hydrolase [Burkholderiaceae bacterium]|nr:alpha/beta hydrolase [Burkholderiaceae bacterium]
MTAPYAPQRAATARQVPARGLSYHLETWGDASLATPDRPLLLLLHGWMDVGASFQFMVDAMAAQEGAARWIAAPDWRGFGRTSASGSDSYWFPDYLGDLDALIEALSPTQPIDLLGHSMGGNVVMGYAGVRPERVRKLVNLEGFGLPATQPAQAPRRLRQWLEELKAPAEFRLYASADAVAARLMQTNPRLAPNKAAWLATRWAAPRADGQWALLADGAHKRVNPALYQADESIATWAAIGAPLLWIEGAETDMAKFWGQRYSHAEFEARLAHVAQVESEILADCGHRLHHDQPEALAARLLRFLG